MQFEEFMSWKDKADLKTVLILEDMFLKASKSPCLYYQVGNPISKNLLSLGFRKGFTLYSFKLDIYNRTKNNLFVLDFRFTNIVNKALVDFHSNGKIKFLDKKWFSDIDEKLCNDKAGSLYTVLVVM